jgi:uncharacterized protein (DUF952 family)
VIETSSLNVTLATLPPVTFIYHIASRADWEQAQRDGQYTTSTRGVTLAEEGFIHASTAGQVPGVAGAFYRDAPDLVLLVIEAERVGSPIRYESPPGVDERYPHIYGPLNPDAVVEARPLPPESRSAPPEPPAPAQPAPHPARPGQLSS